VTPYIYPLHKFLGEGEKLILDRGGRKEEKYDPKKEKREERFSYKGEGEQSEKLFIST